MFLVLVNSPKAASHSFGPIDCQLQSDLDFCRVSKELTSKPTDRWSVVLVLAVAQTGWPSNLRWPSGGEKCSAFYMSSDCGNNAG